MKARPKKDLDKCLIKLHYLRRDTEKFSDVLVYLISMAVMELENMRDKA